MNLRNLRNILILAIIFTYAYLFFQIFTKNIIVDTDYPYHMHNIWAASKGFLVSDPFLSGGAHLTLRYGGPIILLGAAVYPIFGEFTAALLLAAAVPSLWYSAKKVYKHFSKSRIAEIAALGAVLNPFTMYYCSCLLPFIWGVVFALGSIHFYLEGRTYLAVFLGLITVITHPLAIFLFLALLLVHQNFRKWLKTYCIPLAAFGTMFTIFWGIPNLTSGGHDIFPLTLTILNIGILTSALVGTFLIKKETRILSGLALLVLISWSIGSVFGLWFPKPYLNRIGFSILLMLMPFLIKSAASKITVPPISPIKYVSAVPILAILIGSGVYAGPLTTSPDNADAYLKLPDEILTPLQESYVLYASDGSALYELPKLGVRFTNTGRNSYAQIPENAEAYAQMVEMENASFILIYEDYNEFPGRVEAEENIIQELGYPLIYSQDNIKIYKTHLGPENIP